MPKTLLFSVGIKDCKVQYFRSGGPGGQNQNKVSTGVRVIHEPSNAVGECRETRSQHENKKRAFLRMIETSEFKVWHKLEIARRTGKMVETEQVVAKMMEPRNLKIEVQDSNGRWTDEKESYAKNS